MNPLHNSSAETICLQSLLEVSLLKAVVLFASSTQFSLLREVFERTYPQYTLSRPVRPHEHGHGHGHEGHEHTEAETPPRPFPPQVIVSGKSLLESPCSSRNTTFYAAYLDINPFSQKYIRRHVVVTESLRRRAHPDIGDAEFG